MFSAIVPFDESAVEFPEEAPVFPLPGASLLPGEPLPLYIFEERYKRMTEDALSGNRFIVLAGLDPKSGAISSVAGLGRIAMEERLGEGKYNIVLLWMKRVKISSYTQERPYRKARFTLLDDSFSETASDALCGLAQELYERGREILSMRKKKSRPSEVSGDFENLPFDLLPLGMFCDLVGAFLSLPPQEKSMILDELDAVRRAEKLLFFIRCEIEKERAGFSDLPNSLH